MTDSKKIEDKPVHRPATYAECHAFINGNDGGLVKKSQVEVTSK